MKNFLRCSQLVMSGSGELGVAYKAGQANFTIVQKKAFHDFRITVSRQDYEGACGASLGLGVRRDANVSRGKSDRQFVVARKATLSIYSQSDFRLDKWKEVPRSGADSDDVEVMSMTVSKDATKIGLCMGRRLHFGGEELTSLVVYEITKQRSMLLKCQHYFTDPKTLPGSRFMFDNHDPAFVIFFTVDCIRRIDWT